MNTKRDTKQMQKKKSGYVFVNDKEKEDDTKNEYRKVKIVKDRLKMKFHFSSNFGFTKFCKQGGKRHAT